MRRGRQHVGIERQDVPRTIMERCRNVTLCIDIMFVNKIPFLVMISRGIKFSTVETLTDRKHPTIMSTIKHVVALYSKRGFRVSDAHTEIRNLYKSCILSTEFNSPPNLVRDKGIYSTRAGSMFTSAGPAWDLRVQPYGTRRGGSGSGGTGEGTDGSKKWRIEEYCLSRRSLMKWR
jgi:hypothetical protein